MCLITVFASSLSHTSMLFQSNNACWWNNICGCGKYKWRERRVRPPFNWFIVFFSKVTDKMYHVNCHCIIFVVGSCPFRVREIKFWSWIYRTNVQPQFSLLLSSMLSPFVLPISVINSDVIKRVVTMDFMSDLRGFTFSPQFEPPGEKLYLFYIYTFQWPFRNVCCPWISQHIWMHH